MNDRTYRKAVPEDASRCIEIRGRTRENAFSAAELRALGITADTWRDGIANGAFPGYVCCVDEGEGIGKALLRRVVDDFRARGFTNLFLGCSDDPAVRSHGFYRHLGWTPTGERDAAGDEILALRLG